MPGDRRQPHASAATRAPRALPLAERSEAHAGGRGGERRAEPVGHVLARIAAGQGGRLRTRQLLGAGLSSAAISRWAAAGRLHDEGRGLWSLGHRAAPVRGPLAGALLAVAGRATLGFGAAAWVDGFGPAVDPPFDVLVDPSASGRVPTVRPHRVRLADEERRLRHGLAITTAARTLLDLATVLPGDRLETVMAEALVQNRVTLRGIDAIATGRRGAPALRTVLERERGPALTRSEIEVILRRLVRASALPAPVFNTRVLGHSIDAFWPERRLALEVDSLRFHRHAGKFERDRRKGLDLEAAGIRVLRASALTVRDEPLMVIARLASALTLAASRAIL